MRARGADFSSSQSLAEVSQAIDRGLDFAFVKASQGVDYLNPLLDTQASTLRRRGVPVGYYHFLQAAVDGASQWDRFEAAIGHLPRGPVALDYEQSGTTDAQARAFIARGRQRGYRVGVYGGEQVTRRRLGQAWRWVAKWSQTPPVSRWDVWQFTDGGGRQDYDVFNGGKAALRAWWVKQSAPRRRVVRPGWWLTDERTKTALGPLWGVAVGPAFFRYSRRHPRSRLYTLEHK